MDFGFKHPSNFQATLYYIKLPGSRGLYYPVFLGDCNMGIFKNRGTPKSIILIGFSRNPYFSGTFIFQEPWFFNEDGKLLMMRQWAKLEYPRILTARNLYFSGTLIFRNFDFSTKLGSFWWWDSERSSTIQGFGPLGTLIFRNPYFWKHPYGVHHKHLTLLHEKINPKDIAPWWCRVSPIFQVVSSWFHF